MINRLILFGKDILALKFDVIMSLKKKKRDRNFLFKLYLTIKNVFLHTEFISFQINTIRNISSC